MMPAAPAWEDPRRVLSRHGLRPKRSLSQNFLISPHAVESIAKAAVLEPGAWVVELGPGLGTLTGALLRAGARVLAVERDRDMLHVLHAELDGYDVRIERGDVTRLDYPRLAAELGGPLCVVGNLPYAVTGIILRNLIASRNALSSALVMVQREVRDRLHAAPAAAAYGALTVFTSAAFSIDTVLRVPPGAFHPRPNVESAVVRLTPRVPALAEETESFRQVVKAAFQSRRKTLRNALAPVCASGAAERVLQRAGIEAERRGETLSVDEFARLAQALDLEKR